MSRFQLGRFLLSLSSQWSSWASLERHETYAPSLVLQLTRAEQPPCAWLWVSHIHVQALALACMHNSAGCLSKLRRRPQSD